MAEIHARRVSMLIEFDLPRGTREAHEVTVRKIASRVGWFATDLMEKQGYTVGKSNVTLTLHTVRHITKIPLQRATKKLLRAVR